MLDKLARRLLQPINTSVISILGMFNALLGIWIMLPFDSLDPRYVSSIAPEWFVGVITLLVGILIVAGSAKESFTLLTAGTVVGFIFWFTAMVLMVVANWRSPDWLVAFLISSYSGFVYANVSVNSRNLLNKKE